MFCDNGEGEGYLKTFLITYWYIGTEMGRANYARKILKEQTKWCDNITFFYRTKEFIFKGNQKRHLESWNKNLKWLEMTTLG